MHPETLVDSLGDHLSTMQDVFKWSLVLALGVAWAGIQNEPKIEIGALKFDRRQAFRVAAGVYFVATMTFLIVLMRIEATLGLLQDVNFVTGYSKIASHSWVLNPFGYAGTTWPARLSSGASIGLLVIAWWVCLASVYTLRGKESIWRNLYLPIFFYAAGIAALCVVSRIYSLNLGRLETLAPLVFAGLKATAPDRWLLALSSLPAGLAVFVAILRLPGPESAPMPPAANPARTATE
jgi:hypothetical protein